MYARNKQIFGIVVYMFFNDHNPPYFKVQYNEIDIKNNHGLFYENLNDYFFPKITSRR